MRRVQVPNLPEEELARLLAVQLGQHFPIPAHELAFDYRLGSEAPGGGRWALIGAVRAETLRKLLTECAAAGFSVRTVLPISLGAVEIARSQHLAQAIVLEHTEEGLALDVVEEGELRYSRLVPMPPTQEAIAEEIGRTLAIAQSPELPIIAARGVTLEIASYPVQHGALEALSGAGVPEFHLELPEQVEARRHRLQRRSMTRHLAVAAAALVLTGLLFLQRQSAQREALAAERSGITAIRKETAVLKETQRKEAELNALTTALDQAFQPAQPYGDVVTIVSNALPDGVWLTGVTIERGKPIQIRGLARHSDAVAEYLRTLSANGRFREMKLLFANKSLIDTTPVVQFSITGHVIGNLPLAQEKRGRA